MKGEILFFEGTGWRQNQATQSMAGFGAQGIAVYGRGDSWIPLGTQAASLFWIQGRFEFRDAPPFHPQRAWTITLAPRSSEQKPDTADFPSVVIRRRSITADFPSVSPHPASITADFSTVSVDEGTNTADFSVVLEDFRQNAADFATVFSQFSEITDEKASVLIAGRPR
jgi:hypothetical protein